MVQKTARSGELVWIKFSLWVTVAGTDDRCFSSLIFVARLVHWGSNEVQDCLDGGAAELGISQVGL